MVSALSAPSLFRWLLALVLAPFLMGIINRVKAMFAGRRGQPLLQPYHDLFKLLRKGAVYSQTTTWIFRAGPAIGLAAALVALAIVPGAGIRGPLAFTGDFLVLAYTLGMMRFATVLAALDTGSAFEGMGASREMQFALLAEPAFLLSLAVLAFGTGRLCLSDIYGGLWPGISAARTMNPALASAIPLVAVALFFLLLAENARIPVDDPNTHLELTMIHDVMVLDHGGVDLAFIQYGAALKLWLFASLLVGILPAPATGSPAVDLAWNVGGVFLTAALVGVVESVMARLHLLRVPKMLVIALALSLTAFFWLAR